MLHLFRRLLQSLTAPSPDESETSVLRSLMSDAEFGLWSSMSVADQRHSLTVLGRFIGRLPDASPDEIVGVAMHDVGKVESGLGTFARVLATVVGPRTSRFARYHDHEAIGIRLLGAVGSSRGVIAMLDGSARSEASAAFRWADRC